jgi:hypothetical protein
VQFWVADSSGFDQHYESGFRRILVSFAFISAANAGGMWVKNRPMDAEVFVDSGAFGVFTGKAKITLDSYSAYVMENLGRITQYAALDVIGDWRASARNYDLMLERGLRPIPAFHKGSPYEELRRLAGQAKQFGNYIALGGMAAKEVSQTMGGLGDHLDASWKILREFWPIKVHAFGVVSQEILERYPFFSADSTSTVITAGMGNVVGFKNGLYKSLGHWVDCGRRHMDLRVMDGPKGEGPLFGLRGGRVYRNNQALLALERYLTTLWGLRGVVWADGSPSVDLASQGSLGGFGG